MGKRFKLFLFSTLSLVLFVSTLFFAMMAFTERVNADCAGVKTSVINCNTDDPKEGIFSILAMVVNIFTFGVGIAATGGFIFCGYQYMTSKNEPGVIVKIKTRIMHIVIGILFYAMFWGIINFLLPGGLYGQ